eukprot:TRINITY_DN96571_c0_g1_i3.p3 TRINITY_DN96571_c0_g1~~TRINITY_DN96571_c0_g1_i3.p3  ORF type:complete len:132 (+),score=3.49 TRINITY_DN96571_c0_g1_i3:511-906(+)
MIIKSKGLQLRQFLYVQLLSLFFCSFLMSDSRQVWFLSRMYIVLMRVGVWQSCSIYIHLCFGFFVDLTSLWCVQNEVLFWNVLAYIMKWDILAREQAKFWCFRERELVYRKRVWETSGELVQLFDVFGLSD